MAERARPQAALLDRDGTIIEDRHYLHDPGDVVLLPGAASAIRRLSDAGIPSIVITNQSGIARGLYTEADHAALCDHLRALLLRHGIALAGIWHCPHHPQATVERLRIDCDCRKPAGGMIRRAAAALGLDVAASVLVGDRMRDVAAGRDAGVGRCYLVGEHDAGADDDAGSRPDAVYADLLACARAICTVTAEAGHPAHRAAAAGAGA